MQTAARIRETRAWAEREECQSDDYDGREILVAEAVTAVEALTSRTQAGHMRAGCERFKGSGAALFHSDRCEPGELLAVAGSGTDCTALGSQISSRVWGVVVDGQCQDIYDTDVKSACERYAGGR